MKLKQIFLLIIFALSIICANAQEKREFRGAWIQCVNGQFIGKTSQQIREMLAYQLDVLHETGINAIMFQVRPEGDALYKSSYEPWSRFLTGQQGLAPADGWDPLEWMVEECHKRCMECHAWINPYRAKTKGTTTLDPRHAAVRHPERVFSYDNLLIFNPALEANRMYTCMVVEDILNKYDVDGIHIDDYFYPYPVAGQTIPDEADFRSSPRGFTNIGDWRRDNVNKLIKQLHYLIRNVKPWVKFGVSPFGIYRNSPDGKNTKEGSATRGTQNYDDLYADVILWQKEGWVDYEIPQIYWNIGTQVADYEILCKWWNDNCNNRPLFIGQDVDRTVSTANGNNPSQQLWSKYRIMRSLKNISGSCQWYAAAVVEDKGGYRTSIKETFFKYPALQPLMPFMGDKKAPKKPSKPTIVSKNGGVYLTWNAPKAKKECDAVAQYVVYRFKTGEGINLEKSSHIIGIVRNPEIRLKGNFYGCTIMVTSVDRLGNESKPVKIQL